DRGHRAHGSGVFVCCRRLPGPPARPATTGRRCGPGGSMGANRLDVFKALLLRPFHAHALPTRGKVHAGGPDRILELGIDDDVQDLRVWASRRKDRLKVDVLDLGAGWYIL